MPESALASRVRRDSAEDFEDVVVFDAVFVAGLAVLADFVLFADVAFFADVLVFVAAVVFADLAVPFAAFVAAVDFFDAEEAVAADFLAVPARAADFFVIVFVADAFFTVEAPLRETAAFAVLESEALDDRRVDRDFADAAVVFFVVDVSSACVWAASFVVTYPPWKPHG